MQNDVEAVNLLELFMSMIRYYIGNVEENNTVRYIESPYLELPLPKPVEQPGTIVISGLNYAVLRNFTSVLIRKGEINESE